MKLDKFKVKMESKINLNQFKKFNFFFQDTRYSMSYYFDVHKHLPKQLTLCKHQIIIKKIDKN